MSRGLTRARAMIRTALGDFDEAVRLFREAFDRGTFYGPWVHQEPALDEPTLRLASGSAAGPNKTTPRPSWSGSLDGTFFNGGEWD